MLRSHVMRNVVDCNPRHSILGCASSAPFFVSPAAKAYLAHPDCELAIASGCASEGIIQCISNNASLPLLQSSKPERLPNPSSSNFTSIQMARRPQLLHKCRSLLIKAIFVTVDAHVPSKRVVDKRMAAEKNSSAISGETAINDKKGSAWAA